MISAKIIAHRKISVSCKILVSLKRGKFDKYIIEINKKHMQYL